MQSNLYNYVKNQVLIGNFDKSDLATLVQRSIITDRELEELSIYVK